MSRIKAISAILGLILALGAAVPLGVRVSRSVAGTDALEARVAEVEQRLSEKIIKDRMAALQERMWKMEDRFAVLFRSDRGRSHRSIDELVAFMDSGSRSMYRQLVSEYVALEAQLKPKKGDDDD